MEIWSNEAQERYVSCDPFQSSLEYLNQSVHVNVVRLQYWVKQLKHVT